MLLSATRHSNNGDVEETIKELKGINQNLIILSNAADLQPNSRFVLKEQREYVSQKNLAYFNLKFPVQETIYGQNDSEKKKDSKKKKPRQIKRPWTEEEQAKFLEGLEKFKANIKKISDYVGTRTVSQVRSHLQKHKLKLEKQKKK